VAVPRDPSPATTVEGPSAAIESFPRDGSAACRVCAPAFDGKVDAFLGFPPGAQRTAGQRHQAFKPSRLQPDVNTWSHVLLKEVINAGVPLSHWLRHRTG